MTKRDKVGLFILLVLFAVLIGLLVVLAKPQRKTGYGPEDNVLIRQRMINLEKSKR